MILKALLQKIPIFATEQQLEQHSTNYVAILSMLSVFDCAEHFGHFGEFAHMRGYYQTVSWDRWQIICLAFFTLFMVRIMLDTFVA